MRLPSGAVTTLALVLSAGSAGAATQTFTVVNNGISSYLINSSSNPSLTVVRGNTVVFNITATGHPFYVKTVQGAGTGNAYTDGVTGNGTQNGTLTWVVDQTAPNTLFYDCSVHPAMTGTITVLDAATPGAPPGALAAIGFLLVGLGAFVVRRRLAQAA
jgi:hypothetical protein